MATHERPDSSSQLTTKINGHIVGPLGGESTGDDWIPSQRVGNVESVFMLSRRHADCRRRIFIQHTKQSGRSPKVVALFSATNFSNITIELLQLHDTIQI